MSLLVLNPSLCRLLPFHLLMLLFQCHAAGQNFTPTGPLFCGNPALNPPRSHFLYSYYFVICLCSKHHKSFDPFQEQKETSFKELQSSAESLAQFLCEAMETTSVISGDGGGAIKSVFDTLLQVCKIICKKRSREFNTLFSRMVICPSNLVYE